MHVLSSKQRKIERPWARKAKNSRRRLEGNRESSWLTTNKTKTESGNKKGKVEKKKTICSQMETRRVCWPQKKHSS